MEESNSDLLLLGSHCDFAGCCRLDFLPFKCGDCGSTFCLDHRLNFSHDCKVSESSSNRLPNNTSIPIEFHPCLVCQKHEHIPVECSKCCGNFCFTHRHPEDHSCSSLVSEKIYHLAKVKHPSLNLPETIIQPVQPKDISRKKLTPMALKVKTMKLKMIAVGDNQIAEIHRWYLEVFLLDGVTSKSVFISDEWTFGKACDSIKRSLKVDLKHEKAKLRDAVMLDIEIPSDRLVKDVLPSGGSLQFVLFD